MRTRIQIKKILLVLSMSALATACAKYSFTPIPEQKMASVSPVNPGRKISATAVVAMGNEKVDFLLVLDDSNSMSPELKKLANRMSNFVRSLDEANLDWQICLTTTRGWTQGGSVVFGVPMNWVAYSPQVGTPFYVLKKGTQNLNAIFTSTIDSIQIGGGLSGDERAIKVTADNFLNSEKHDCYRDGAAISVIAISDEDERSIGGNMKNKKNAEGSTVYQPLEADDYPLNLISVAKLRFGADVRFTFNSIILKPGDLICEAEQDADTSPSHFGYIYEQMSQLSGGGVGSICDADYSANLNTFKDKIVNSLSSLILECTPLPGSLQITEQNKVLSDFQVDGKKVKFQHNIVEGTTLGLNYECID